MTFKHVFGETTIKSETKRIISLSAGRADTLWVLGVKPIAVRYWYGDHKYAAWPWAQKALVDSKPFVIKGELDSEKIAELQPDLILAVYSGLKKEQYGLLSKIAPTIAHDFDENGKPYDGYGTPWDFMALTAGKAVGKYDEAKQAVDGIHSRIGQIAKDHPEWKGKTATIAYFRKDRPGAYTDTDIRMRWINQMGLVTNPEIMKAQKKKESSVSFSREQVAKLESDVLIWIVANQAAIEEIKNLEGRKLMKTHKEGRKVLLDVETTWAFWHSQPFLCIRQVSSFN